MKIAFICSSLEPGRDGVGDYTRRLAGELIRQGNKCKIVALNDKHMRKAESGKRSQRSEVRGWRTDDFLERQESEGVEIECLRLPDSLEWKERIHLARQFIGEFDPNWISLQFVCFGFHPKGLPIGFSKRLREIIGSRKLHIMFHELWCGMNQLSPSKERFLGVLQKYFILRILAFLKPSSIFTSTDSYHGYLGQLGVEAEVLPIFGGIPLSSIPMENEWNRILPDYGLPEYDILRTRYLMAGIFASIYPCKELETTFRLLAQTANKTSKKLTILLVGNQRCTEQSLKDLCPAEKIQFIRTGFVNEGRLNALLYLPDLAIATTPIDGINKSSAAAAWIERGIPIIVPNGRRTTQKNNGESDRGVFFVRNELDIETALASSGKLPIASRLASVAEGYLNQFQRQ